MIYQVIAAGAMGLFAFDYGNLWLPKAHNPPKSEWEKVVKVFTEFKDEYMLNLYILWKSLLENHIIFQK